MLLPDEQNDLLVGSLISGSMKNGFDVTVCYHIKPKTRYVAYVRSEGKQKVLSKFS